MTYVQFTKENIEALGGYVGGAATMKDADIYRQLAARHTKLMKLLKEDGSDGPGLTAAYREISDVAEFYMKRDSRLDLDVAFVAAQAKQDGPQHQANNGSSAATSTKTNAEDADPEDAYGSDGTAIAEPSRPSMSGQSGK